MKVYICRDKDGTFACVGEPAMSMWSGFSLWEFLSTAIELDKTYGLKVGELKRGTITVEVEK